VGGLLDLVADGETGLLVPPRDVPALREALEALRGRPRAAGRLGGGAAPARGRGAAARRPRAAVPHGRGRTRACARALRLAGSHGRDPDSLRSGPFGRATVTVTVTATVTVTGPREYRR